MKRFALQDVPSEQWKNGGGTTRTIASRGEPDAPFDWRVSVAEIAEDGPFSIFAGVDRTAVVLENGPLRLTDVPALGQLKKTAFVGQSLSPLHFRGEARLFAHIGETPVLCLNVMTRRASTLATVNVISSSRTVPVEPDTLLFAAGSNWQVNGTMLAKYEGFRFAGQAVIDIRSPALQEGPLIAIAFFPIALVLPPRLLPSLSKRSDHE
jgi:environmental stress-induced protein Ves